MDFTIREFIPDDYVDIYRLNREELGYEYPLEATKEKLLRLNVSNSDKIYVALIGDEIAGYIHASDYDVTYAPHMKNIMGIAVSGKYRRRGVGRALLESVETWAKETGAKGVRLVSGEARTDAHTFYHNCGYVGEKKQLNLKKMLE